jgi:hypothetical protein
LNKDGYWLASEKHEGEWGFMFKKPELTLAAGYPQVWARIHHEKQGQFETDEGLWTYATVNAK